MEWSAITQENLQKFGIVGHHPMIKCYKEIERLVITHGRNTVLKKY
jgi:hypothetical protein